MYPEIYILILLLKMYEPYGSDSKEQQERACTRKSSEQYSDFFLPRVEKKNLNNKQTNPKEKEFFLKILGKDTIVT